MKQILKMLLVGLTGTLVWASGSSSGSIQAPRDPMKVTQTITAVIVNTQVEDKLIAIKPNSTGTEMVLKAGEKIRIKTKLKADFGGRKKLDFADLAPGQEVKITYIPAKGEITYIKVQALPDQSST